MRVKCIAVRAYPGAHRDPYLKLNSFYAVEDPRIYTIADTTPYIRVKLSSHESIERPRHLFGPLLENKFDNPVQR